MAELVLNVIDGMEIVDNIIKVIPSYLDRLCIDKAEYFIIILDVE